MRYIKFIALSFAIFAIAIAYICNDDQKSTQASTQFSSPLKKELQEVRTSKTGENIARSDESNKKDYRKMAKQILNKLDAIENESPRVDSTAGQKSLIRTIYSDQIERMNQLLINQYKNNFQAFIASSELSIRAMFHFGGDQKYGIIFLYVVKKFHEKEFKEKCVEMTLMSNRSRPNLKRLNKVVYQCIAWQPIPRERLFISEYLFAVKRIKGKEIAFNELENLKTFIPEDRYNKLARDLNSYDEENI